MAKYLQDRPGKEDIWNCISILWTRHMRDTDTFVFARLTTRERITKQDSIRLDWGIINIPLERQGWSSHTTKLTNRRRGNRKTKLDRTGLRIRQHIIRITGARYPNIYRDMKKSRNKDWNLKTKTETWRRNEPTTPTTELSTEYRSDAYRMPEQLQCQPSNIHRREPEDRGPKTEEADNSYHWTVNRMLNRH